MIEKLHEMQIVRNSGQNPPSIILVSECIDTSVRMLSIINNIIKINLLNRDFVNEDNSHMKYSGKGRKTLDQ